MKAPDSLSPTESANLAKMGDDIWSHVGKGYWTRNNEAPSCDDDNYIRGQMIAALWRSGYVKLLPGCRARKQEVPRLPDNMIRA